MQTWPRPSKKEIREKRTEVTGGRGPFPRVDKHEMGPQKEILMSCWQQEATGEKGSEIHLGGKKKATASQESTSQNRKWLGHKVRKRKGWKKRIA